jgi:hypothetical protein
MITEFFERTDLAVFGGVWYSGLRRVAARREFPPRR